MSDCTNAEVRDQLPELVNERLSEAARSLVFAHLADCGDCRDEVELLRDVRTMLVATTPRVDLQYVIEALPKPVPRGVTPLPVAATRRRVWADWRIAAAVTLLLAGAGSITLIRQPGTVTPPAPVAMTDTANSERVAPVATVAAESLPGVRHAADSAPTGSQVVASASEGTRSVPAAGDVDEGRFGDLSEPQLQKLLNDIEQLKPVPVTEPEPVTIRVNGRGASSEIL